LASAISSSLVLFSSSTMFMILPHSDPISLPEGRLFSSLYNYLLMKYEMLFRYALPVGQEALNADIGKRMLYHLHEDVIGNGSNMGPNLGGGYAV